MVAEYITGLKVAWDVAKTLKIATDAIDDAHIKLQMAELISALADAKIEAAENAEVIYKLKQQIDREESLIYEKGLYFRILVDGEKDGPFCQKCYDSEGLLMRTYEGQAYIATIEKWGNAHTCRKCNSVYGWLT